MGIALLSAYRSQPRSPVFLLNIHCVEVELEALTVAHADGRSLRMLNVGHTGESRCRCQPQGCTMCTRESGEPAE